jgi:uncharacterized protein (TIGR02646 family)
MKRIIKNLEPAELSDWKASYTAKNGKKLQDLYKQDNMTGKTLWKFLPSSERENRLYSKAQLRLALLQEQGFISCYCNREIEADGAVIEHFMPKGTPKYRHLVYDYDNLLASCDGFQAEPKPRNVCCDAKRLENHILPLRPTEENIENHFTFTIDGQVVGLSEEAENMIAQLGLNITQLESLRATYIRDAIYENPFTQTLIDSEIAKVKIQELQTRQNEKFTPFCTAIINVLRREILNENANQA